MKLSSGDQVWGTVMNVSKAELSTLYSAPSVADYYPASIQYEKLDGKMDTALTYILPADYPLAPPASDDYPRKLVSICKKLALPSSYTVKLTKKFINN